MSDHTFTIDRLRAQGVDPDEYAKRKPSELPLANILDDSPECAELDTLCFEDLVAKLEVEITVHQMCGNHIKAGYIDFWLDANEATWEPLEAGEKSAGPRASAGSG